MEKRLEHAHTFVSEDNKSQHKRQDEQEKQDSVVRTHERNATPLLSIRNKPFAKAEITATNRRPRSLVCVQNDAEEQNGSCGEQNVVGDENADPKAGIELAGKDIRGGLDRGE